MRRTITRSSIEWPWLLSEIADPPARLLVEGLPLEPDALCVGIVGTRRPTVAGLTAARCLAADLARAGVTIVSGMAVGIDAAAHEAALAANGRTIAVLGCGLDVDYPRRNRSLRLRVLTEGTAVTEYGEDGEPQAWHFPRRNRIIAGLCSAIVVVEGSIKSGALVTARLALDANRNVFAVPGSTRNAMAEGPNELIRRGEAGLITCARHLLEEIDPDRDAGEGVDGHATFELDEIERAIVDHLDDVPVTMDSLAQAVAAPVPNIASTIAGLEMRGLVKRTLSGYSIADAGARARRG